jgi:predicted ABC-type ATPase
MSNAGVLKAKMEKRAVIAAGANGVGKTTFALQFLAEHDFEFLNADEIAKELSAGNPSEKKISAGKIFFKKLNETVTQGKSLLLESTLSGRYLQQHFGIWRANGYQIQIVFIFVESPEVSIARIKERVKKGGHFVPDEDVRRRFDRGKKNFWQIYKNLADSWSLFYNSEGSFNQVAIGEKDDIFVIDQELFNKFEESLK